MENSRNSWCMEVWKLQTRIYWLALLLIHWRRSFSNNWGLRRFLFAVHIIPPTLNNRSTAADEGSPTLNFRNILRTSGYLSGMLSALSLSSKYCKPCNSVWEWSVVLGSPTASAIKVKKSNVLESTTSSIWLGIIVFCWCSLSDENLNVFRNKFFMCSTFAGLIHRSLKAGCVFMLCSPFI